ncbi:MAG TPA: MarR family transcriptional regulator [Myxococcales bacterium]|nr:MarR family transcriptional regulator [Myxococcales bacterium]
MPTRPTPEALAEELREITVALRRYARAEVVEDDATLTYPQLAVLKRLEAEGPAASADLARGESMTPQSMGVLVVALEAAGYVRRRDDAGHGRRRLVSMTAAGRRALADNRAALLRSTAKVVAEQFDAKERQTLADAFALLRRAFLRGQHSRRGA